MQPPFPQGFVLKGRYAIRSTIGQGGMGRTYLAQDLERFNETCVLKEFIPPQDSLEVSEKAKELFRREASVLYQIRHPQVPEFRATFESEGRLLLVQDYVEGKNYRNLLLDRLKSGQTFSENEVFALLQMLLPVLSYLHNHNIIHRDISPENLMLRSLDNLPVLIDFGVVQETNAKLNSQMGIPSSTVAGKAGYAPPEQLQSGNAYANSDLYALAVTSIVLMTGREPSELFDSINLAWNWQQYANVNPAFARVINQMLSYKPANRYRSADEVMQALQIAQASFSGAKTYVVGRPVPANVAASIPQRTVLAGANNRTSVNYGSNAPNRINESNKGGGVNWFVGILIILVAGIGSWAVTSFFFSRNRLTNPTETAITSPTNATGDPTVTNVKLDLSDNEGINRKSISDKIVAGKIVNVRLTGERDDFLTVSLTNGDNLQMTIENADQVSLDSAAKDNKTGFWEGRLPKSGTYYIKIKTTSPQETTYNLEVTRKVMPKPQATPTKKTTPTPTAKPTTTATPTESPTISPSPDPLNSPRATESPRDTASPTPITEPTRSPSPPITTEPAPEPRQPISTPKNPNIF
ncbi:MAG: protein kinase domain-containing protein [Pseudanabaena sp.]|jgi:serine/threonine protein kinase|uniref:serine/threonine protein kinase n=1 Tax=Pseudanabaena mucicola TaxID=71190 RepID=UPI0025790330|nr:serine/threonine protein kinase [Pseudanabaena mucicola]MCA6572710.1 serine/threonine protein kinase [Pseudanabaena sp. M53BS1SP1A06MG]MCA6583904.1 serine/threonine protein kinase [Pseudanabaena sp. M34BS1SP1A06MG]MCA6589803.1 serine/threonine protein kinase [Pseudanabaena sp. M109S1SP1A06QC]MCA6592456.1 serine/threonine protein kinase [Pseudanabaena sp. M38BS1SP1A06MG]MCA6597507.1 serine/threonine protein kinase [Pseudanabaena sp. M046S1SP1A06QC]MCA6600151.1 serine/threonine protein kinas